MRISAVILAGGRGERLWPLTNTRPKPLCPVGGAYPLERAISLAREAGAGEIIITAGYLAKSVEAYAAGMDDVTVVREDKPLSTAGAVKNARPSGELILVLCGDTVCDFSLLPAVKEQMRSDRESTIVTVRSSAPTDYGVVSSQNGVVTGFIEKPSWSRVSGDEVNTGIYVLRRRLLREIPDGVPCDFGSELFPRLVREGRNPACVLAEGYWCDMGTPSTYFRANMAASGGETVADGSCVIDEDARVVRSVLMSDVYVGAGTRIDGAVICENVKIGRDCVISEGCVVGADCVIEDGARLAPGVSVTNGVYIRKGTEIMKNIYANGFRTRLFDSELGVGGVYGADFDIADAVYLGQALCTQEKRGERARVGVMSGDGGFSRILAGVTVGGIRFGGGDAVDLGEGFLSLCGFSVRAFGLDFAVFVSVDDSFGITISVFDRDGLLLSREAQRRLERVFFRRPEPKNEPSHAEAPEGTEKAGFVYADALLSRAKTLQGLSFSLRTQNAPDAYLRAAASKLGAEVSYGDSGDVFDVSPDGMRATAVSSSGRAASHWHLLCWALGEGVKNGCGRVALPAFSPVSAAAYLAALGAEVTYYTDSESDDRALVGSQWWSNDGCMLVMTVADAMKRHGITLDGALDELPMFFVRELNVPVDEDEKAERARILRERCDDTSRGTAFVFGSGRVSVAPSNGAYFKVFAEAVSSEAAEDIGEKIRKLITEKQL